MKWLKKLEDNYLKTQESNLDKLNQTMIKFLNPSYVFHLTGKLLNFLKTKTT